MDCALWLAKLEARHGVNASYYFLITSDLYNVLSRANSRAIQEISALGFEVGLHFDPTVYEGADAKAMHDAYLREKETLERVTGQPVVSASLHNPSTLDELPSLAGVTNCYDPPVFKPESFLSDSCKDFRGKDPFTFLEGSAKESIQLLLHPLHYYSSAGGGYSLSLSRCFAERINRIDRAFRGNRTYQAEIGDQSLLEVLCATQRGQVRS